MKLYGVRERTYNILFDAKTKNKNSAKTNTQRLNGIKSSSIPECQRK